MKIVQSLEVTLDPLTVAVVLIDDEDAGYTERLSLPFETFVDHWPATGYNLYKAVLGVRHGLFAEGFVAAAHENADLLSDAQSVF